MSSDYILRLRQEFRGHLEEFYTHLNLAPPYHSIEKAVQLFSNTLRTRPEDFSLGLLEDGAKKWALFQEIFLDSGLQKKHRGIIKQLALSHYEALAEAPESRRFLENFLINFHESNLERASHPPRNHPSSLTNL
jgi:hypothetical protein